MGIWRRRHLHPITGENPRYDTLPREKSTLRRPATLFFRKLRKNVAEMDLTAQKQRFFGHFFDFWAFQAQFFKKSEKNSDLNKGFQATAHKLSHGTGLRSLQSLFLQSVGRRLTPDVQFLDSHA